jgi:hypothetical protein
MTSEPYGNIAPRMNLVGRALAALVLGTAVWCSFGALGVQYVSGGVVRLGLLPPWWVLGACIGAALPVTWLLARLSLLAPALFLSVLCLPWLPGRVPAAFLVWTGPLAWGAYLAVAFGVVWTLAPRLTGIPDWLARLAGDSRRAPLVAALVTLILGGTAATTMQGLVPAGDEPHYLVITQSLLYDGDLRIENNHARGDYGAYFPRELPPDYLRRGIDGEIYSVHAPGLALLVLPAFALGGYSAVVVFLVVLAGCGSWLAWRLAWAVTGRSDAAWFGWAAAALSVTTIFHTFTVFPDGPAAVAVLIGVWGMLLPLQGPAAGWLAVGAALAWLPWLHTRAAALAFVLGALIGVRLWRSERRRRNLAAFALVPSMAAAGWFAYFQLLYGELDPRAPYGGYLQTALVNVPGGLIGLLVDQQFGLLAHAPALALALVGFGAMVVARRAVVPPDRVAQWRRLGLGLLAVIMPYLLLTAAYRMWWGGESAPARFLAPVTLCLSIPAAVFWATLRPGASRFMAGGVLGLGTVVTLVLVFAEGGWLAYDDRSGRALVLEWAGRTVNLPTALPAIFRVPPETALAQAAVWMSAGVVAWLLLVAIERVLAPTRAQLAACGSWLGAAAIMLALTAGWSASGEPRLRPEASQMEVLRAAALPGRTVGLRYSAHAAGGGTRVTDREHVVARLQLGELQPVSRPDAGSLELRGVPAGEYEIIVPPTLGQGSALSLSIGPAAPIASWRLDAASEGRERRFAFTLPVHVDSIVVRSEGLDPSLFGRVRVVPARVWQMVPPGEGPASRADRYGETTVYFLSGGIHPQEQGFWILPGRSVHLLLHGQPRGYAVELRNGPVEHELTLAAGRWRQVVPLAAGGRAEVLIPAFPDGAPTTLELFAAEGYVPRDVYPGSQNFRRLGVWIAPR